ncbi:heterokaryon incompatibility protein-domain-containing protein [Lophiotrema nucula]|uniref:Heterokaryon incompatibility protein-domain-containing protein n=1 Tax=Lophiotrema nucula TaxID=690887 RepID=A0A6A5ZN44_9PLEO|nr:heterokaryon incompatibility protein-domain-containing protein [Lophiotrema nucula]
MAAHWLRSCIKGHASCIQSHGKQYSPTRVVDLQHADGSEVPRLLQHVELDEPYVALSHRWGMTGLPATTRVNLQQRLRSIPVAELSPILRDVVVVTRELGFRYIWVDALCIIQDSESDWLNEASKMSDVYSGASLTIAAAEAEGHSEGMFRPRRAACFRPFYIDRHKGVPHRKRETPNGDGPLYVFPNTPRVFSGIRPKSTLDSRGWVLQEQLLSPRILYFGDGELFWDCITMSASESWPVAASLLADSNSQETWALKTIRRAIASGDTSTSHLTRLQDAWRFITANYSARQLTKAADKLIAINGILSSLATIFDDAPVAGMWRKDIWRQLIWWTETPTPIERPSRIPSFIAPTWSWLNSKGPIRYHNATYSGLTRSQDNATSRDFSELHPQCVVIDVHSNDNSAGEITGLLTIKGPCFDYNLRKDDMKKSIQKRWNQAKTGINAGVWLLDEKMELPQVVRCLVMAEDPVAKVLVLLCLVPVDDKDVKARYKRIGLCHWDGLSHEIRRYAKQEPVDKTLTIV